MKGIKIYLFLLFVQIYAANAYFSNICTSYLKEAKTAIPLLGKWIKNHKLASALLTWATYKTCKLYKTIRCLKADSLCKNITTYQFKDKHLIDLVQRKANQTLLSGITPLGNYLIWFGNGRVGITIENGIIQNSAWRKKITQDKINCTFARITNDIIQSENKKRTRETGFIEEIERLSLFESLYEILRANVKKMHVLRGKIKNKEYGEFLKNLFFFAF